MVAGERAAAQLQQSVGTHVLLQHSCLCELEFVSGLQFA
jgi:hypothetical protein